MQPMTLDEFKELIFPHPDCPESLGVDPLHIERIAAALEQREELLEARKLLLGGPVDEPQIELRGEWHQGLHCGLEDVGLQGDGYEACDYGFEAGVERALEWAQGLFSEIDERRPDCREADQPGGKPGETDEP